MSTAILPRMAPNTYQASQLFKDLSAAIPSYFKRTRQTFSRVTLQKLDASGQVRTFEEKDKKTGQTRYFQQLPYIENTRTGQIYHDESSSSLILKCSAIILATPFYTVGTMIWNAYQLLRSIGLIAKRIFQGINTDLSLGRYYEATKIFYREIRPLPCILKERIWAFIQAPLFGIGMELAALSGMIRPFHGRDFVAMVERAWHNGVSYKEDWRRLPEKKDQSCASCCEEVLSADVAYLAYCFQARGNTHADSHLKVLLRDPL
jgi:hypothetical protein